MERRATTWFEQKPDCYCGPTCDQVEPRWYAYADGDKDADYQREPLVLDARRFPPGTKITVEEPVCPSCGETRWPMHPEPKSGPLFQSKCGCGFDWDGWTLNHYS